MQTADHECDSKDLELEGLTFTTKSSPSLCQREQGCRVHLCSASMRQFHSAERLDNCSTIIAT